MIAALKRWYKTGSLRSQTVSTGSLTEYDDFWYSVVGGSPASSGAPVNRDTAMRQWVVYSCISIISETLAQLPLKLKRPDGKGGTEDAIDHPLYNICKNLPNEQMTSFSWREAQQANLITTGNCYNFILKKRHGVAAIIPIAPSLVTVRPPSNAEKSRYRFRKDEKVVFEVVTDTGKRVFHPSDILHIAGFGFDGLQGISVITNFAKESIGNAIALDKFQGAAMKNGVTPSGVLEHPDTLGDNTEKFIAALRERYSGYTNAKIPMVLENGMKFNKVDVSLVDRQFIEQMKMTSTQICGIFKVPPHKVGIYEKNTNYNNTEQGNRAFIDSTIQQWVIRWEQAMNWKLLSKDEREKGFSFKFNFDALLRPDAKTRSELEWKEWQMGTPLNVIRKRNDENPIEGQDVSYVPVNMIPAELAGEQVRQNAEEGKALADEEEDDLRRYERNAVARLISKDKEGKCRNFKDSVDDIYTRINRKIEGKITTLVRCFYSDPEKKISDLVSEFRENKTKLLELRQNKYRSASNEE